MVSFNVFNLSIAAPQRGSVVGHMFHDSPVAGSMTLVGLMLRSSLRVAALHADIYTCVTIRRTMLQRSLQRAEKLACWLLCRHTSRMAAPQGVGQPGASDATAYILEECEVQLQLHSLAQNADRLHAKPRRCSDCEMTI